MPKIAKPELMNDEELLNEIVCLRGKPIGEAQDIVSEALLRLFKEYVRERNAHIKMVLDY